MSWGKDIIRCSLLSILKNVTLTPRNHTYDHLMRVIMASWWPMPRYCAAITTVMGQELQTEVNTFRAASATSVKSSDIIILIH